MSEARRGVVYGLTAYVLWGLLTVFWKELTGLDPFELIGQRIVWSSVLLLVVLAVLGRVRAVLGLRSNRRLVARLALASLLLATNWTTYVWCVTHDNVVETALGYFIAPLGTVALGVLVLGERLRRPQLVALGLAVLAVLVLTVGYGEVPWFALLLGVSWALYGLLKRTVPLAAVESLAAETLLLLPAALVLVAAVERRGDGLAGEASGWQWALVVLSGVVTVVPLTLFAAAARRVPLTTLGPLQYAVPTINFVLGVVVYDEPLPGWRLAGFALVWVALVLMTADALRTARSRSPLVEAVPA